MACMKKIASQRMLRRECNPDKRLGGGITDFLVFVERFRKYEISDNISSQFFEYFCSHKSRRIIHVDRVIDAIIIKVMIAAGIAERVRAGKSAD